METSVYPREYKNQKNFSKSSRREGEPPPLCSQFLKLVRGCENLFHASAKHLTRSMACYTENTYGRNMKKCLRLRPEVFTQEQATRTCQPRRGSVVKIFLAVVRQRSDKQSQYGVTSLSATAQGCGSERT